MRDELKAGNGSHKFDKPTEWAGLNPEDEGRTLYLGRPSSKVKLRIYDKALEQKRPGPWVRFELELHDEKAHALAKHISTSGMDGLSAVLKGYLDIKEPTGDSNKSRRPTVDWYDAFLGGVSKAKLGAGQRKERTVESVKKYMLDNLSGNMAFVFLASGRDMSVFLEAISRGLSRLTPWHKAQLAALRVEIPSEITSTPAEQLKNHDLEIDTKWIQ